MTEPGRLLSGLERVWLAADRIASPFVNQCVLTPALPLDPDRLETAVARAAAVHPGMGVRLRGLGRRARWETGGPPAQLRSVPGDAWDARSPAGAPFLDAPLDPRTGPVAEVLHVTGRTPRLVVRTHHAALDGRGTQLFIEDLLAVYDGGEPRGAEAGPTVDVDLARGRVSHRHHEPPADAIAPCAEGSGAFGHTWLRRTLPPLPSPVLPRVLAALEASVAHPGRLRISIPVDLRRYAPELRSSANLTGVAAFELPRPQPELAALEHLVKTAADGGDAAAHVMAGATLRGTPIWLMLFLGRLALKTRYRQHRWPISAVVSNLGRHGWRLGGAPVEAFWIPPPSPGVPLFLTLTGQAGAVELCAAAPMALADGGRLERLVAAMVERLAPQAPQAPQG